MPEGPEIRRAADRVASVLVGNRIEKVSFGLPDLKRFEKRLAGRIVTAVDTVGKAMLTRFDNDLNIYSHNQLYGRWYTVRKLRMPDTQRQLRIELCTETHKALLYSASDIAVLDNKELLTHPFLARAGPDILDRNLTKPRIIGRLNDPRFRNRALGNLYLDQVFLAGNGNYLRSEILWAAGIEPARKPSSLSKTECSTLASQTKIIATRSYKTGGITVTSALAASLKAEGCTRAEYRFNVFGRDGLPCRSCGAAIERRTMCSRNLFTCRNCQQ